MNRRYKRQQNKTNIDRDIIIHKQSKSVNEETFTYGFNFMNNYISELGTSLSYLNLSFKNILFQIQRKLDKNYIPFSYKGVEYGVRLDSIYQVNGIYKIDVSVGLSIQSIHNQKI